MVRYEVNSCYCYSKAQNNLMIKIVSCVINPPHPHILRWTATLGWPLVFITDRMQVSLPVMRWRPKCSGAFALRHRQGLLLDDIDRALQLDDHIQSALSGRICRRSTGGANNAAASVGLVALLDNRCSGSSGGNGSGGGSGCVGCSPFFCRSLHRGHDGPSDPRPPNRWCGVHTLLLLMGIFDAAGSSHAERQSGGQNCRRVALGLLHHKVPRLIIVEGNQQVRLTEANWADTLWEKE